MKSIRTVGSLRWVWLAAFGLGLAACGGSNDASRPTGPVKKVAWNDEGEASGEAPEAAAEEEKEQKEKKEAPEAEEEEATGGGNVIDLDAPAASAEPKAAPRAKAEPEPRVAAAEEPAEEEEAEEEAPAAKAEPEPEAPSNDPLAAELRKRRAQAKARSEAGKEKEKAPRKKKAKPAADGDVTVASYKGSDPCRAAKFSVSRVREACASGGRPAAKRVMKDAIGKATATGQLLKCSDCHSNQRDYSLKSDAVADLKRWLDGSSS